MPPEIPIASVSAPRPPFPLEQIRARVAAAVEARGLRPVAREIGLSPTGVGKFIVGTSITYGPTAVRLKKWYQAHREEGGGDELAEAIETIAARYPPALREQATARLRKFAAGAIDLEPVAPPVPKKAPVVKRPPPQREPSRRDILAATAHFQDALQQVGDPVRVASSIRRGIRALGENPDEVTEV